MAYLKELRTTCQRAGCPKQTVVEAFDNHNQPAGSFCRAHGKWILAKLEVETL